MIFGGYNKHNGVRYLAQLYLGKGCEKLKELTSRGQYSKHIPERFGYLDEKRRYPQDRHVGSQQQNQSIAPRAKPLPSARWKFGVARLPTWSKFLISGEDR